MGGRGLGKCRSAKGGEPICGSSSHRLVVFVYCAPLLALTCLYDHLGLRSKCLVLAATGAAAVLAHVVFAQVLGWV